jgi:hypothetical protein
LKYEGEDFVASCSALMELFSVPAGDLVERLESAMFQLQHGMVNPLSAVSGRHIEAVRQELVKKRKQEEQLDPDAEFFAVQSRERKDKFPKFVGGSSSSSSSSSYSSSSSSSSSKASNVLAFPDRLTGRRVSQVLHLPVLLFVLLHHHSIPHLLLHPPPPTSRISSA